MSRKNRIITPAASIAAVAAAAGVVQETGVVEVAGVGTHQDDNLAGDIASAVATGDPSGLVADGAVAVVATKVEGTVVAETVIAPRPNGDQAGDIAAAVVTGDTETALLASIDELHDLSILDVHSDWSTPTEAEFKKAYPLTVALLSGHQEMSQPVLRITPKVAGFRRGGFAHPAGPTDYRALALRPSQIEAILSEPSLVVEVI